MISNVLAERYASTSIKQIWSGEGRIVLEREWWIAVMKAQQDLGLEISDEAIAAYESVKEQVDLNSIMERERITRHDVKARIDEFCELAGHEEIHKGMTSRDLTENVEQLQVFKSLQIIRDKAVATLGKMSALSAEYRNLIIGGRTHNVSAQPTTLGKRIAMFGEELLGATQQLENIIETYAVRGLKGAVGTQMDQISLFDGEAATVLDLEQRLAKHLGIQNCWTNVGQVYPRSLDFRVVSNLSELASAPSSFCKTLRLMSGHELASEGFAKGQTGSSAMPHKMNARSCERVNGFHTILKGYLAMVSGLSGDQWNEGDVSCSVVRRVALPDAFFAIDGLLETFLTILNQMKVYEAVITQENKKYFPFLATTSFLMASVKAGVGRETAHEAIKENAVATVEDLRAGIISENDLLPRLAKDERIPLSLEELEAIFEDAQTNVGAGLAQVDVFLGQVASLVEKYPSAKSYEPETIL